MQRGGLRFHWKMRVTGPCPYHPVKRAWGLCPETGWLLWHKDGKELWGQLWGVRSLGTGIGVRLLQDLAVSGTGASKVIEKVVELLNWVKSGLGAVCGVEGHLPLLPKLSMVSVSTLPGNPSIYPGTRTGQIDSRGFSLWHVKDPTQRHVCPNGECKFWLGPQTGKGPLTGQGVGLNRLVIWAQWLSRPMVLEMSEVRRDVEWVECLWENLIEELLMVFEQGLVVCSKEL